MHPIYFFAKQENKICTRSDFFYFFGKQKITHDPTIHFFVRAKK